MFRVKTRLLVMVLIATWDLGQVWAGQYENSDYWNKIYKSDQAIFVHTPTALLVSGVKDRKPGKALDIGMGQGRNSIFLAQQGWDVTGFDPSEVGVREAEEQSHKLGLHLHAIVAREQDFDLGTAKWDLIVMTYVRPVRAEDSDRFAQALRPHGIFIYENNNVGKRNELLRTFLGWRIIRFEDVDTHSDWHPNQTVEVERLIAEKP